MKLESISADKLRNYWNARCDTRRLGFPRAASELQDSPLVVTHSMAAGL